MARTRPSADHAKASPLPPAAATLAEVLRRHLQSGGFQQGERYLSVRQIARRFAVSPVTAHRALFSLAQQGLLVLRKGSGAYVAKPPPSQGRRRLVQLFLRDDPLLRERVLLDGLQLGLIECLPGDVTIQIHFIPRHDMMPRLTDATAGRPADGVVLMGLGRAGRQFFQQRRNPTVVIGTSEDDLKLASVGHDQAALGAAVVHRLASDRRRQAILAMHAEWDLGDNQLVDALQRGCSSVTPRIELRVQSVPSDPALAEEMIQRMLASLGARSAMLCRSGRMALHAGELAQRAGVAVPQRTLLVALGCDALARGRVAVPLLTPPFDDREVGGKAAALLIEQWSGDRHRARRINLPQPLDLVEATG